MIQPTRTSRKAVPVRVSGDVTWLVQLSPRGVSTGMVCASRLEIPTGKVNNLEARLTRL